MKRLDLIQLVIIIVALMAVYLAIGIMPDLVLLFISWIYDGMRGGDALSQLLSYFVFFSLYLLSGFLLVNRSNTLARYISEKFDIDFRPSLNQSKNNLLYILFIGLGFYNLIIRVPILINNLFKVFSNNVNNKEALDLNTGQYDFILLGLQVLLPLLLIIFAKDLANYFSEKISNTDDIEDLGTKNND